MDNGSQRTFITTKLKNELKLRTIGLKTLNMVGFGDRKSKPNKYEQV